MTKFLILSLLMSLLVTAIAVAAAYLVLPAGDLMERAAYRLSRQNIAAVAAAVEEYKARNGRLPSDLRQLNLPPSVQTTQDKQPMDGWGTALAYEVAGNDFAIISCGPDRTRGGPGGDLSSRDAPAPDPKSTFGGFLASDNGGRAVFASALAGGLAFFTNVYSAYNRRKKGPTRRGSMLVYTVIVFLAATIVGVFLAVLHIATSGH